MLRGPLRGGKGKGGEGQGGMGRRGEIVCDVQLEQGRRLAKAGPECIFYTVDYFHLTVQVNGVV